MIKKNGKPHFSGKNQKELLAIPVGESMLILNHRKKHTILKTIETFGTRYEFQVEGSHVYRLK